MLQQSVASHTWKKQTMIYVRQKISQKSTFSETILGCMLGSPSSDHVIVLTRFK